MKQVKKLAAIVSIVVLGWIVSFSVTFYTAKVGNYTAQTDQGCRGTSYIASGFPVRDIYLVNYDGGECGLLTVHQGNTGIRPIPFLLNWIFWSIFIAVVPSVVKRLKNYAHSRH